MPKGQYDHTANRKPLAERFWAKVDKSGDCWLWTAQRNNRGYGVIWCAERHGCVYAHRVAWEFEHGAIPDGLEILHACDTPACVRIDHLSLGTHRDNMIDAQRKGRASKPPIHLGSRHPQAKMTEASVRELRHLYASGASAADLAERYGIHVTNVVIIAKRQTWRHVA